MPSATTSQEPTRREFKPYKPKKKEAYMSPAQQDHFRAILNAWRDELTEELERMRSRMQDEVINCPDPTDRASQESEMALELRTRDRERKLIIRIDKTLEQIDEGDYGYCEECGADIGLRRLEARPTAKQCIDCKSLAEIREKQMG